VDGHSKHIGAERRCSTSEPTGSRFSQGGPAMTASRYCHRALRNPSPEGSGHLQKTQANRAHPRQHSLLLVHCFVICSSSRAIVPRSRSVAFSYPSSIDGRPL
jgi:hypothetical protein